MRTLKKLPKKLYEAVKELMKLYEADLPGGRIHSLVIQNEVSEDQVYELLESHGYAWQQGKWQLLSPPSWLQNEINRFESKLKRNKVFSLWEPPDPGLPGELLYDITIFRDYLENMEAFIDTETQDRRRKLEKISKPDPTLYDPDDPYDDWEGERYFAYASLEQAEEFAYILRKSFLVNLYAYIETFLVKLRSPAAPPKNSIIKGATTLLVGPLVQKIPQWDEILRHVKLRNCLVHNDGVLDKCKKLEKYVRDKPTLSIRDIRKDTREEPIEQIILEKGFCEEVLETVDKFLYSVHVISEEKKQSKI